LRAGLDRGRVEVVRPAVPGEVPQVQHRGQREQPAQRRAGPTGIGLRPAQQAPGPAGPGTARRVPRDGNGGGRAHVVRSPWVAMSLLWTVLVIGLVAGLVTGQGSGARSARPNTQCRYSRNLITVAARLAASRTPTSASRPGWAGLSRASEPAVRSSPRPNAISPL